MFVVRNLAAWSHYLDNPMLIINYLHNVSVKGAEIQRLGVWIRISTGVVRGSGEG